MNILKMIKLFLRLYVFCGVLGALYVVNLTSCAQIPVVPELKSPSTPQSITSVEEAQDTWNNQELTLYTTIWNEESLDDGDAFSAGLAAYNIASILNDYNWSSEAYGKFTFVLDRQPDFVMARSWRGSASALQARNYPVGGVFLVIPGPGFHRLYHVKSAFSDLNVAVEAAPNDPIVRLIRAASIIGMPAIFGGHDDGINDFMRLQKWTDRPESNAEHSALLKSETWLSQYYLAKAKAMMRLENNEEVIIAWKKLEELTTDPLLKSLAKWKIMQF